MSLPPLKHRKSIKIPIRIEKNAKNSTCRTDYEVELDEEVAGAGKPNSKAVSGAGFDMAHFFAMSSIFASKLLQRN